MTPSDRGGEERKRFEEWTSHLGYDDLEREGDGYANPAIDNCWSAWQAALSRAAAPSRDALWAKVEDALNRFEYSVGCCVEAGFKKCGCDEKRTALVAAIKAWGDSR